MAQNHYSTGNLLRQSKLYMEKE